MRRSKVLAAAAAVVMGLSSFAMADVLDQVPDQATTVVQIHNLGDFNTKLGGFFKELGVDQLSPAMADPIHSFFKMGGATDGIDDKADAAFVHFDGDASGGDEKRAMLILIPVTDYKAFIGNFADAVTKGDVTEAHVGQHHDLSYIASWGKYAAITPSKEIVAMKPTGSVKLSDGVAKKFSEQDVVMFVNLVAAKKSAPTKLAAARDEMIDDVTDQLPPEQQKNSSLVKAVITQLFNIPLGYINDASSSVTGLSITPTGIHTVMLSEFAPGTYSAGVVSKVKNTEGSLLAGLPNNQYLIYGGTVNSPEIATKLMDDFSVPIVKEAAALGDDGKAITSLIDSEKQVVGAVSGSTFGVLTPGGMMGKDAIFQVVATVHGDSKKITSTMQNLVQHQGDLTRTFAPEMDMGQTYTLTPAAKTIDGVSFDQIVGESKAPAANANPQQQQMQDFMKNLAGPLGTTTFTASLDADTTLIGMAVEDPVLQSLVTAAKAKDDSMATAVPTASVADDLPKSRAGVMYICLDNMITTGLKYAAAVGFAMPITIAPNQPPIAISYGTEGNTLRVDTVVPTKLMKSIAAAAIQFKMQMQGGGQHGGQNGGAI